MCFEIRPPGHSTRVCLDWPAGQPATISQRDSCTFESCISILYILYNLFVLVHVSFTSAAQYCTVPMREPTVWWVLLMYALHAWRKYTPTSYGLRAMSHRCTLTEQIRSQTLTRGAVMELVYCTRYDLNFMCFTSPQVRLPLVDWGGRARVTMIATDSCLHNIGAWDKSISSTHVHIVIK